MSNFLWTRLSEALSENGPPVKQKHEWKKTWSDIKYKVKGKLSSNKHILKGTGGGSFVQKKVTELEESIIQCAGLEAAVEGVKNSKSFGAPSGTIIGLEDPNNPVVEEDDVQERETSQEPKELSSKVKAPRKNKEEGLIERFVKAVEDISNALINISETLQENKKILKRRYELEDKIYRLKKQKYEKDAMREKEKPQLKKKLFEIKIEQTRLNTQRFEKED